MPLVEIAAATSLLGGRAPRAVLEAVNRAIAESLRAPRSDVAWSAWRAVDPDEVAVGFESDVPTPVVVHVYGRRTPEEFEAIVAAIERTLEAELDLGDRALLVTTQPFRGG